MTPEPWFPFAFLAVAAVVSLIAWAVGRLAAKHLFRGTDR